MTDINMITVRRKVKPHLVQIIPLQIMPEVGHRHSKGAGMEQYQFPYELPLISELG